MSPSDALVPSPQSTVPVRSTRPNFALLLRPQLDHNLAVIKRESTMAFLLVTL